MTFKIGDVVRLKSGGVPMCVTAYHPDLSLGGNPALREGTGTVSCTWLTTDGVPKSYAFDERLVEPVRDQLSSFSGGPYKDSDGSVWEYINGKLEKTRGPDVNASSSQFCSKCGKNFPDDQPIIGCAKPGCAVGYHPAARGSA